jgi:hypothetical protein
MLKVLTAQAGSCLLADLNGKLQETSASKWKPLDSALLSVPCTTHFLWGIRASVSALLFSPLLREFLLVSPKPSGVNKTTLSSISLPHLNGFVHYLQTCTGFQLVAAQAGGLDRRSRQEVKLGSDGDSSLARSNSLRGPLSGSAHFSRPGRHGCGNGRAGFITPAGISPNVIISLIVSRNADQLSPAGGKLNMVLSHAAHAFNQMLRHLVHLHQSLGKM